MNKKDATMKVLIEFIKSLIEKLFQNTSVQNVETVKKPTEVNLDDIEKTKEYQKENNTSRRDFFEDIKYKNDSKRLREEHLALGLHNDELGDIIEVVNAYTNRKYKKPLILTMIFRTQSEQDYLYRNSARYKKKKFISPHQLWHGVDIRSHNFTSTEIKEIEAYINTKYNTKNYYRWTAKFHNNGNGNHFHVQFIKKGK